MIGVQVGDERRVHLYGRRRGACAGTPAQVRDPHPEDGIGEQSGAGIGDQNCAVPPPRDVHPASVPAAGNCGPAM